VSKKNILQGNSRAHVSKKIAMHGSSGARVSKKNARLWYSEARERAYADYSESMTPSEQAYLETHPLVALQMLFGITDIRALRCYRRGLTRNIKVLQSKSYRSRYYAEENKRRRLLAKERRRVTDRSTLNPCPTPDQFRAAFAAAKKSPENRVLFGGLVHDLACYVDSRLRIDTQGNILGRNGGIRAWLDQNVPELFGKYKTIMRYKALAVRVRQVAEINDPIPTSSLFAKIDPAFLRHDSGEKFIPGAYEDQTRGNKVILTGELNWIPEKFGPRKWVKNFSAENSHSFVAERCRRRVEKVLEGCENTFEGVMRAVEKRLE